MKIRPMYCDELDFAAVGSGSGYWSQIRRQWTTPVSIRLDPLKLKRPSRPTMKLPTRPIVRNHSMVTYCESRRIS
jgi:hypothetical protein